MDTTTPAVPRIRWNSLFVKLSVLIFACATVLTAVTSYTYTRASLHQLDAKIAQTGAEVNGILSDLLAGAVMSRAPGPIERELSKLTKHEESETRYGIAIDANGQIIAGKGPVPEDATALIELARQAMAAGETAISDDGMMVANPVINAMSGQASGALASSWTSEFALAEALRAQVLVVAVAAVTVLLGVVLMMVLIRRWITTPMTLTARSVDAMAADDLDVAFASRGRRDELGDIGKSLEMLRKRLLAGREDARENRFRGTAFASSSAAIMTVGADMRITTMNQTVSDILTHYVEDFRQITAEFDPEQVIGREMDFFHAPGLRDRVRALLMDPAKLPYRADIVVGDARFNLMINRVEDVTGALEGFVVEWIDVTNEYMNSAILNAIESNQVKAEFGLDGALLHTNAHFARALRTTPDLLVGHNTDTIFSFDETLSQERGGVFERLNEGDSVYGSFRINRKDGSHGVIDGGFTPVLDPRGRLLRIILIGNDMSEAKHALELAEAERLQMLDTQANVVDALRKGLERLAEGDLTDRIADVFPENYDQLRADFNLAVDRLQEAMRGVVENADLIQGEASEISSAADDLSARTERQAATLEQTASALDQLTSSVKSAADGANHANELVETARENAEASGEVVREAVEAMGEIESSSQQISKITGVIDDIAFQTNLLALNAGVEAARAGEAGRGFAVVASEVRALAQRSSDAAREINALISASGTQVKRGVDLVDQAGAALKGIVDSVTEISRNVNEIAVSSREQSAGLAEINAAVNQLDQVTQQNAAMFEETTAASHALTREAETLTRTMSRFQTGGPARDSGNVVTATFVSQRAPEPASAARTLAVSGAAQAPALSGADDDGWDEF
jgi:methyl-accepting chemotaxis protein